MKKKNLNYPYPVLSYENEDYINSKFHLKLFEEPQILDNYVYIDLTYILECDGLKNLILNEDARVVVYVESVTTEYRKIFCFNKNKNNMKIKIYKNDLNQEIILKSFIIASKDLNPFSLPEHNNNFFNHIIFDLKKGDILGIAEEYKIALTDYDPLKDTPSIFVIRRQTERPNEEISMDYSGDKINILLNDELYDEFSDLNQTQETSSIITTFYATPVLIDVLYFMRNLEKDQEIECETRKWYIVIRNRLKQMNIDLENEDSMVKVANQILAHVFKNANESLTYLKDEYFRSGEENEN